MSFPPLWKLAIAGCGLAVAMGFGASIAICQTASFHIGNSLTADSYPYALPAFAEMRNKEHSVGFHIRGASSLTKILEDPFGEVVVVDNVYGNFTSALPGYTWGAVTLQPYKGNLLEEELASALEFIDITRSNPANADTVFYIYESWPDILFGTYQAQWLAPLQSLTNPFATRSRAFFDLFYDRLSAETDATIKTIPVGEVLYEFDIAAQQGKIPGYDSVNQLYRDHVHLSLEVGRYIASATTFSTILNETPIGLTKPDGFFFDDAFPLSPEFYDAVNRIIRTVLNDDPHSGVYFPRADYNNDGMVDQYDLSLWEDSYPGPQYDVDRDGRVDALDFLRWQRAYDPDPLLFDDSAANLNGEGLVDGEDLAIWTGAYQVDDGGDLDHDGDSDGLDFLALQRALTPFRPTDANHDRRVDGADLERWEASYGYSGPVDFDEDRLATGLDFLLWQRESSVLAKNAVVDAVKTIPEPASLVGSLCLALICLSGRIRPISRVGAGHALIFKIARMRTPFS